MLRLWPVLLDLQLLGNAAVSMVPFVSLTSDILKFKVENDTHTNSRDSTKERTVLSWQACLVDACLTHKALPKLLNCCRNLYEMKKCVGLFARVCNSKFLHDCNSLCSTLLGSITSSSLVKCVVYNWLLLPSQSTDIHYIRNLFNISSSTSVELLDDDTSLLATVVRKLTVLIMKCLSVMVEEGKGKG